MADRKKTAHFYGGVGGAICGQVPYTIAIVNVSEMVTEEAEQVVSIILNALEAAFYPDTDERVERVTVDGLSGEKVDVTPMTAQALRHAPL